MNKKELTMIIEEIKVKGAKFYSKKEYSTKDLKSLHEIVTSEKVLDRKMTNFVKWIENKIEENAQNQIKDILDQNEQITLEYMESKEESKEEIKEPKEEIKKATKKEAVKTEEKKVANTKVSHYEKMKSLIDTDEKGLRGKINKFITHEITSEDLEKYFEFKENVVDVETLKYSYKRCVLVMGTKYGYERVSMIDFDYKDNKPYYLSKSFEMREYDFIYPSNYSVKHKAFKHPEGYTIRFFIPVPKQAFFDAIADMEE